MIDTIKVGIPLTAQQHKRILKLAQQAEGYQWVLLDRSTGRIFFKRVKGLAQTDQHSYHRELRWDIDTTYDINAKLTIEFSVPKFWYGHNIHLLHNFLPALDDLRKKLNKQFNFSSKSALVEPTCWTVLRLDLCYAWRMADRETAKHYLNSLKHLSYPKKKPIIYDSSIVFPGGTLSLKFYLKEPEFKVHDYKELLKAQASLEWVEWLELLAIGVLRCEATLRAKYLRRQEVFTVADLLKTQFKVVWDEHLDICDDDELKMMILAIFTNYAQSTGKNLLEFISSINSKFYKDGMRFEAPEGELVFPLACSEHGFYKFHHPGGGFSLKETSPLQDKLQGFITKFIGNDTKLQSADRVKLKLLQKYQPVKASRLVSFWLYVQRFGEADARETFGKNSFYRSKSDLKKAGIGLLSEEKIGKDVDKDFLRSFELTVPSKHCTNQHDDFRDSANVLNFVPMTSGNHF